MSSSSAGSSRVPATAMPSEAPRSRTVTVLYNDDRNLTHGTTEDALAVASVSEAAEGIAAALRKSGYRVEVHGLGSDLPSLVGLLSSLTSTIVFNLLEALGGNPRHEATAAGLLELCRLPYTGSPPETLALCLDKDRTKAVLAHHGLPIAPGRLLVTGEESLRGLLFPVLVKPVAEDASHGISLASVVNTEPEVRALARTLIERYRQPALCETYLPGREFNVSVLGSGPEAAVLDLFEIDFDDFPGGGPSLVTYAAKWHEASEECRKTPAVPARALTPELADTIRSVTLEAYRVMGLRGYGRIDLRLDRDGRPCILEVNPNPDLSPSAGVARAAKSSGVPYATLVQRILEDGLRRAQTGLA